MDIRDIAGLWCDDITFCPERCGWTDCPRNSKNIRDRTIPHSYSVGIPKDCPKQKAGETMTYAFTAGYETMGDELMVVRESRTTVKIKTRKELTDDQVKDLYWVALAMETTGKRMKDIMKEDHDVCANCPLIPVKPRYADKFHAYCGVCNKRIGLKHTPQFCMRCGCKIDWT